MACHGKGIQDCLHLRWIGQQVIVYPLNINWSALLVGTKSFFTIYYFIK